MAKRVPATSMTSHSSMSNVLQDVQKQAQQMQPEASQNDNTVVSQNDIVTKPQRKRKTDERDRVTYYLEPGQLDKLEDLRADYRKATGKRISEQDFMRLIIDRLDLQHLI